MNNRIIVLTRRVESKIKTIRGRKVILDSDLAELYGVEVKRLNEQVRRNIARFPSDFLFRLMREDCERLRSQFATSKKGRGGRRYSPFAFTEHGAIMAATVLNSERAIQMSVFVVRAFVKMREVLAFNKNILDRISALERKVGSHDADISEIVQALRDLMSPPSPPRRRIGFQVPARDSMRARRCALRN